MITYLKQGKSDADVAEADASLFLLDSGTIKSD